MKNNIFKIAIILLSGVIALPAMELSQAEKEKRAKAKEAKINACLANLPSTPVPKLFLDDASFSENNTFEIGEKVIFNTAENPNQYWYGCVINIINSNQRMGPIIAIQKKTNQKRALYGKNIGKIQVVPSLKHINIKNIANQIRTGKLKKEDIKPPVLPQEMYDKIIEEEKKIEYHLPEGHGYM